ncbi:pyridoxal 5'-phosphate synthase glutaminase subunit PdxT [Allobranchiibius sp. GilTou38]|uniref:pyridoxal 5'-phosphate synthase glutaminase subunit PdxT n=1 Tax=Allobranchiibius sp. GilTou38 TaxID=2815210 RepID=UPI001AA0F965|nr:pyridoxal 5'-phosphate synthase glutaminase subunit PdxT [Allobranchiibius sp. GilTou38]
MTKPRIGVLAVQGDVREHLRALASADVEAVPVRRPQEVARIDGLVLPGGESTTIDKLLRIFELQEPIRARIAAGMPVYGSCAGMILLADEVLDGQPGQQTLGGMDITVRRNAFGRQVDSFETDLVMPSLADGAHTPVHAVFIRAPWVERAGDGVQVLATVPHGPAQGRVVACREGALLATSFHPEVTDDYRVHHYFAAMVRDVVRVP